MMLKSNLLIHSLVLGAAAAASQGDWTNGPKATGTKDPNAAVGCDYWANDVQSSDTCDALVDFFGITQKQLVSWVSSPELYLLYLEYDLPTDACSEPLLEA
jgi:hypothetical protein